MRFLVLSERGDAAGLAFRLKEEGNEVWLHIREQFAKPTLRGLVDQVQTPGEGLSKKPEVVLFDMVGEGKLAESYRKMGFKVLGGGLLNDRLELDRSFAMDFAQRMGMKVPPFFPFSSSELQKAIDFVADSRKTYVLKPHDNQSTARTYVSQSHSDMLRYLKWLEKRGGVKGDFILQERVEGIELSTEVWFSDGNPTWFPNNTVEEKRFLAGNVGPNTGCQSSVVWAHASKESRVVQQTLKKLYAPLRAARYSGPLDVNAIIKDGQPWFLEFTARPGYSAVYALAELLKTDLGQFLADVASGSGYRQPAKDGYGLAIRLTIPPYPLDAKENRPPYLSSSGRRLANLPEGHFWPLDVELKDEELVTAGVDGVVGEVTYHERDLRRGCDAVFSMVEKVEIPDLQYRTDAFDRALRDLPHLADMKYDSGVRHGTAPSPQGVAA